MREKAFVRIFQSVTRLERPPTFARCLPNRAIQEGLLQGVDRPTSWAAFRTSPARTPCSRTAAWRLKWPRP